MAERSISEILEALARIETNLKTIAENGADHEERLRALESRNGKRFGELPGSQGVQLEPGWLGAP